MTLTGTVTALPWDGQKGGLVVIEVEGTLTFSADINVSGQGFRGGNRSINGGNTSNCLTNEYHGSSDDRAGQKGEGIADWPGSNHRAYRGKLANGGGGGNDHNTGGAGGGNYGAGGQGGWTTCGSRGSCPGSNVANSGYGLGGAALSSYLSSANLRLFFGGGGGGGHHNNDQGGNGGNGGGIVLLRAAAIQGGGRQILAQGAQGTQNLGSGCSQTGVSFAGNDGAGGGGAGGAVALFCNTYGGTLTIDVRGANGQNCSSFLCSCRPDHGPGGGGGGGYIAFSTSSTPAGITPLLAGGQNGIELTPVEENMNGCNNIGCGFPCLNCIPAGPDRINRGATPGGNGGLLYEISWGPYSPCPFAAVQLLSWQMVPSPTGYLTHSWEIQSSQPLMQLEVALHSLTGSETVVIPLRPSLQGSTTHPLKPGSYVASLYAYPMGGAKQLLAQRTLSLSLPFFRQGETLYLHSPTGEAFALFDVRGRCLQQGFIPAGEFLPVSLEAFPSGLYLLQIGSSSYRLPIGR